MLTRPDQLTSSLRVQYDVGLCAYAAMLRIVSKFHDEVFSDPNTPSGLNMVRSHFKIPYCCADLDELFQQLDFAEMTQTHDGYITDFYNEWLVRYNESDLSGAYH